MHTQQSVHQSFDAFLHQHPSRWRSPELLIGMRVNRNTLIAIIFSLLLHALILFLALPHMKFDNSAAPLPTAMQVSLAPPVRPQVIEPQPVPEKPIPKPVKAKAKLLTQKPNATSRPSFSVPEVIATPAPSQEAAPSKNQPVDMMAYVNAKRAQQPALEADAARQNAEAVAREMGPSAEQLRDERIKNNFKNGTNGIFEISSLGSRHAAFSFRGWTNDYSNARRESFEVEAATGQDVRLIMIRKMIWLIRQHYQGDFNWDSQRLGRVVVQSAKPEDNAGLEDFMMMEFFGSNYKRMQ